MVCSPTDTSTSSCPPILSLSIKYGISSAYTCIHPSTPWFCASTRRAGSRRWNEVSLCCPWAGLRGRGYPRHQAPRHHHPVCRPGHRHRRSDDPMQAPSSTPGVSPVPTPHREQRAPRSRRAPRGRQLQHPQACQGPSDGWLAAPDFTFTSPPPMLRGSIRWRSGSTSLPARRFGGIRSVRYQSSSSASSDTPPNGNANAHPFMWTATADSILAKIKKTL